MRKNSPFCFFLHRQENSCMVEEKTIQKLRESFGKEYGVELSPEDNLELMKMVKFYDLLLKWDFEDSQKQEAILNNSDNSSQT